MSNEIGPDAEPTASPDDATPNNAWTTLLGPFYDGDQVAALLGVTRQGLRASRGRGAVFGLRTGDGEWAYPAWQFNGTRANHAIVTAMRALTATGVSAWTAAAWMCSPAPELGGRTPLECLTAGEDDELIQRVISRAAHGWS